MKNWTETRPNLVLAAMFSFVVLGPLGVGLIFAGFRVVGLAIAVVGAVMRPVTSRWVRHHSTPD